MDDMSLCEIYEIVDRQIEEDMLLYKVVNRQIKKIEYNSDSVTDTVNTWNRLDIWDRLFQIHGEDWDSSTLEKCVRGVYIKSGATTLKEFEDYIELQLTFL